MPRDDHSDTTFLLESKGDPLLEFPSEPQPRVVLGETKDLDAAELQFLPEASESLLEHENLCASIAPSRPKIGIKRLSRQGARGTEGCDKAALLNANGKPILVGRVLNVGVTFAKASSSHTSFTVFVAVALAANKR
jgi:hypothetical protein